MENVFKNIPRYEFSSHNKTLLLEFLKTAKENMPNKFCNLQEYEALKQLYPLSEDLKNDLEEFKNQKTEIIDIISDNEKSQEEVKNNEEINEDLQELTTTNINESTFEDIIHSIKEQLETQKHISTSVINGLHGPNLNLENIFEQLSECLNFEEMLNLGVSLNASSLVTNQFIITCYVKYMLIKHLNLEFSDELLNVVNDLASKKSNALTGEIVGYLLSPDTIASRAFLQFLGGLHMDYKIKLFSAFMDSCSDLKEHHLPIIETFLCNQIDYNSLNKLTELMSNSATMFSNDKTFGKLLINVIKYSGKHVILLEQPLKYIISCHKSIWKTKIQKTLDNCLQESLTMTQSFRY